MLQFFNLLHGYMSNTLYPACTLHVGDDHSPKDGPTYWPVVRSGGRVNTDSSHGAALTQRMECPHGAVVAQTIGSGPLGVMTNWEIRRYGAVSATPLRTHSEEATPRDVQRVRLTTCV